MPTLARFSFWIPPEKMGRFETAYAKQLLPILKKHDLVESPERGRSTVENVFSRLFELKMPAEVAAKERALHKDHAWQEALRSLGQVFGTPQSDSPLRTHFGIYKTPAGVGKTVEAGTGFRQGLWQSFGVQDGLPSSTIINMLQDRDNNLWFATQGGGASRYDGVQFVSFTTEDGLLSNDVWSIFQDREGNLWFSTGWRITAVEGLSRYDGKEFVTFTTEDGLASNWVRHILQDRKGYLWFATTEGLSRYDAHAPDGKQFVTFTTKDGLANNFVMSVFEDREENLWLGTNEGVSRFDSKGFVNFSAEDGLAHNYVNNIIEDREGNLWFGGKGLSRYDGKTFVTFTTEQGLAHNSVTSIVEDRQGLLWFGNHGSGISRYDAHRPDGKQFKIFTTDDGLASNQVFSLLEDHEGNLWVGTHGCGLSRYDAVQFANFTIEDGLPNNGVMAILQDREANLWFGTWEGVCRYDPNRSDGKQFTALDGLAGKFVWSILEDRQGRLWFGTLRDGVVRYDDEQLVTFTTENGLPNNWVMAICEDRNRYLWFGTHGGGVSRYDGKQFVTFTTDDGLAENVVSFIFEDRKGYLWFGTLRQGVSRYDGEQFVNFTTEDRLAGLMVSAILEDRKGNLWVGTEGGGVSRYDAHRPDGEKFETFSPDNGLAYDMVLSIFEDQAGHLWIGTFGGGLSRYDGLVFQRLSRKDGLVNDTVQQILQDQHGDIWIATEGGVTRYRPQLIPPGVRIKEVIADQRYGSVQEIRIPSSQKFIVFEFQGRSLTTPPDGMVYVVRLEGYDPDWKPIYSGRVEYKDIPLGEYVFQVKAVDRDLNYSEPACVRVSVVPDPRLEAFAEALSGTTDEFVGNSPALRRAQEQLAQVAPTDLTVIISGETGTGKGLAARTTHGLSKRRAGPFIQVHCGAIPEALVESELFGHERGAFTGAITRKLGKIELAEKGTLFLDEIGDMPLEAQVKLLRMLEERTFERVGGTETLKADVRVIAATNRDLKQMVEADQFREDLYFRLHPFPVELPPLRERRSDIPVLASYFMVQMAAHLNKTVTHLTPKALEALQVYEWPGNVRELEHALQRAVIVCRESVIRPEDMLLGIGQADEYHTQERLTLEELERRYIREVLEDTGWVIAGDCGAAAILGLHEATLRSRMKKLGIARPQA